MDNLKTCRFLVYLRINQNFGYVHTHTHKFRRTTFYRFILAVLLINLVFYSCSTDDNLKTENTSQKSKDNDAVNGPNPFLTTVMQTAFNNLKNNPTVDLEGIFDSQGLSLADFQITTSHSQYKFLPQDSTQYKLLWNDEYTDPSETELTHLDENLDPKATGEDIDVEDLNDNFEDGAPLASPVLYPLYTIISPNHPLVSEIPNQLIAAYYFPVMEEDQPNRTATEIALSHATFPEMLENEAFKITGNLDTKELSGLKFLDPTYPVEQGITLTYAQVVDKGLNMANLAIDYSTSQQKLFRRRSPWTPSGRLQFEETDVAGRPAVGIAGARVRVRKWGLLVIRKAHTDINGNFQTSSTRDKRVKYAVYFKNNNHKFVIKAGTAFWNARHRSVEKHKQRGWFPGVFTAGTRRHFYAQIQYACFDYYNRIVPVYGIPVPNNTPTIKLSAKYNRDVSSRFRPFAPGFFNDIRITRNSGGTPRGTIGVYATTVHEMTHAAHYRRDKGIFHPLVLFDGKAKERNPMTESWAEGVETVATNDRYILLDPNFFRNNTASGWNSDKQLRAFSQNNEYTAIVYDMIDNFNQFSTVVDRADDRVRDYSLQQIWQALEGRRSLDTWRNEIINTQSNTTENEVSRLFQYYQRVADNL